MREGESDDRIRDQALVAMIGAKKIALEEGKTFDEVRLNIINNIVIIILLLYIYTHTCYSNVSNIGNVYDSIYSCETS